MVFVVVVMVMVVVVVVGGISGGLLYLVLEVSDI
jgi:hypothetical protein